MLIDIPIFELFSLDVVFIDVFVTEDRELLLDRRFFLLSDVKLVKGSMNVLHYTIEIKGETDM